MRHVVEKSLRNSVVQLSGVFLKSPLCLLAERITSMAVMEPDPMSVIFAVALHGVVGEVALGHFVIWINHNLQNVVSRFDVRDVDPLTVDVVAVQIPAAHSDALISKVGTLIPFRNTLLTICVLEAETGFVSFGHFGPVGVQKIIVGEDVHAVVVAVTGVPDPGVPSGLRFEVGPADVVDLGGEPEQTSVSVRPVGLGSRFGQTVLLGSAVEHVKRSVLDVNRLLDQRSVQDQIRGSL